MVHRRAWRWLLALLVLVPPAGRRPRPAPPPGPRPAPGPPPARVPGPARTNPFGRQTIAGSVAGQEVGRVWSTGGRGLWVASETALYELDLAVATPALRQAWAAPAGDSITALALGGLDRVLVQVQGRVGYDLHLVTPSSGASTAISSGGRGGPVLVAAPGGRRAAFVEAGSAGIIVVDLPAATRRLTGPAGAQPFAFGPDGGQLLYWVPRRLAGEQAGAQDNPGYLALVDLATDKAENFSDWYVALRDRGWDSTGLYYMAEVRRQATAPTLTAVWHRQQGLIVELPGLWRWAERTPLTLVSLREALSVILPDTIPRPAKAALVNAAGSSPDGNWFYDTVQLRERHHLVVADAVRGEPIFQDGGWLRADWSPASDRLVVVSERGQWAVFHLSGP